MVGCKGVTLCFLQASGVLELLLFSHHAYGLGYPCCPPGRVEQRSQALFSSSLSLLIRGTAPVIAIHIGELPGGSNPALGYTAGHGSEMDRFCHPDRKKTGKA